MLIPTIEVKRSVWIRLGVALAILVIPATLYFFTYFNSKYDFVIQQRFRALNELEHQFNRGISNFDNLFRFSKYKEFTPTERQQAAQVVSDFWAYLEAREAGVENQNPNSPLSKRDGLLEVEPEKLKLWQKYLHADIDKWLRADIELDVKGIAENLNRELESVDHYLQELSTSPVYGNTSYDVISKEDCDLKSTDDSAAQFRVITTTDPFYLSITDACSNSFDTLQSLQKSVGKSGTLGVLRAKLPIRDLIQPDSALRYFDQIMLLNSEGQVVYRSGQEDRISIDNGSGLPLQVNHNDFARFTDLSVLLKKAGKSGSLLEQMSKNTSTTEVVGSFSRVVEEPVGDMPHLFFVQPLSLSVGEQRMTDPPQTGVGKPWYVIGVVRKSQLLSDVSKVSLNAMASLLILFLLMLLSIPLLKLRFATVTEPISTAQVYLIGTSLILGTCIVTLILMDVRAYGGLKDRMDATAKQISKRMGESFRQELQASIKQNKVVFQRDQINPPDSGLAPAARSEARTALECNRDNAEFDLNDESQVYKRKIDSYPPFELAYLLDAEGSQIDSQITYRKEFARTIKVPQRQYFLHARDGPLWHHSAVGDDGVAYNESFFLERIFTYDHGFWLTALSMPVTSGDFADAPCTPRVRVTLGVMRSFFATVLPPSFGFAVLDDASGEVIYHSDSSRSLLENFFVETDNNEHLITMVRARRAAEFTGNYYGEGHRFYVAPLADTPWSLVVFYDKTLIRTVNFELVVSTITAQLIYVLMILGGLLVFREVSQHKHWRFVWPRGAVLREYRYLASILLLSQGIAWILTSDPHQKPGLVILVALPLFSLSLIAFLLDQKHRWRSSTVTYHWKRAVTSLALFLGGFMLLLSTFLTLSDSSKSWSVDSPQTQVVMLLIAVSLLIFASRKGQDYVPEKSHPGQLKEIRFWYLTCAMLVLILVSVWPTKLLFEDIFQLQTDKLLRMSQHHVLRQVDQRRAATIHDLARINQDQRVSFVEDFRGIYPTEHVFSSPGSQKGGVTADNSSLHYAQLKSQNGCGNKSNSGTGEPENGGSNYQIPSISMLTENFPSYSPLSAWLHVMFSGQANDFNWCAKKAADKLTFTKTSANSNQVYEMESNKIPMDSSSDPEIELSFYAGLIFLVFLMLYSLRTISQRVLGLDFPVIRTHWELHNLKNDIENWRGTRRVVLAPPQEFKDALKLHLSELGEVSEIDLSDSKDQQKLLNFAAHMNHDENDVVLMQGPKFFNCPLETREQLLQALETLDDRPQTTLILCTDLFPWLILALADGQFAHKDFSDEEKLRWQTLFSNFQSGYATVDEMSELTAIEALLQFECRNSELAEICQSIKADPAFQRAVELQKSPWLNMYKTLISYFKNTEQGRDILTARALIDDITQRAKHFHKTLWQCCNEEEKYILYRLAQGNMVNSLHQKLLERLLRLGLIRKDPDFRISSYSLKNFILSEETPEQVRAWEKQTPDSIWTHLRVPMLLLLLTLFVFLAYVGPNVIESIIGLVPAIILAGPLLMRFLSTSGKK